MEQVAKQSSPYHSMAPHNLKWEAQGPSKEKMASIFQFAIRQTNSVRQLREKKPYWKAGGLSQNAGALHLMPGCF